METQERNDKESTNSAARNASGASNPDSNRAAAVSTDSTRIFFARLLHFFTVSDRLARAKREVFDHNHAGWADYSLGAAALKDGQQLSDTHEGKYSAILLFRAAIVLFIRARLARQSKPTGNEVEDKNPWLQLGAINGVGSYLESLGAETLAMLKNSLSTSPGEAYLASLTDIQLNESLAVLNKLAHALANPLSVQANEPSRLIVVRRLRIGLAVCIALASILGAWIKVTAKENLALGKKVVVVTPSVLFPADPKQLVDGDRTNLGFHSNDNPGQMVIIDLGRVKVLSRVDIYNRADCCQQRAIPLVLELSVDGISYKAIASQTQDFMIWEVKLPSVPARYVRIVHPQAGFFHLSEVEVY